MMKYCEQIVKDIVEAIEKGLSNNATCDYVGISKETFYKWIKDHSDFSDQVKRAQSEKKIDLLEKIKTIGEKNWQALAWILERCYPDEFGVKVRQITSEGDKINTWQELEDAVGREMEEEEKDKKKGEEDG